MMSVDEPVVELMGTARESGEYLAEAYDPESGTYYFPEPPDMQFDVHSLTRGVKAEAIAVAFIDTGMLTEHPAIRPRLRYSVDFTGEGSEDLNGHGTLVTLIGLARDPEIALVNVKVLSKSGGGRMSWLVKGLDWCNANAERYNIKVVNLSAGIYHKKWGFLECKSDCSVCNAARALGDNSEVLFFVAAGNEGPNNLPCPQRVGILEGRFLVVSAVDPFTSKLMDYSGRGNIAASEAFYRKVPIK